METMFPMCVCHLSGSLVLNSPQSPFHTLCMMVNSRRTKGTEHVAPSLALHHLCVWHQCASGCWVPLSQVFLWWAFFAVLPLTTPCFELITHIEIPWSWTVRTSAKMLDSKLFSSHSRLLLAGNVHSCNPPSFIWKFYNPRRIVAHIFMIVYISFCLAPEIQ